VRSKTIRGGAEISVIFNPDADMRYSLQLMQGKADEVRASCPRHDARRRADDAVALPHLQRQRDGRPAARRPARPRRLPAAALAEPGPGVADVEVLASEEREISVIVDPDRLNAAKLTLEQVGDALKATNQVVSVGRLPGTTASTRC
jgi:multidrug efflux pump subunit AcrB